MKNAQLVKNVPWKIFSALIFIFFCVFGKITLKKVYVRNDFFSSAFPSGIPCTLFIKTLRKMPSASVENLICYFN